MWSNWPAETDYECISILQSELITDRSSAWHKQFVFIRIQGDEADGMYFIEEGTVKVMKTNEVGALFRGSLFREIFDLKSSLRPGAIFLSRRDVLDERN